MFLELRSERVQYDVGSIERDGYQREYADVDVQRSGKGTEFTEDMWPFPELKNGCLIL